MRQPKVAVYSCVIILVPMWCKNNCFEKNILYFVHIVLISETFLKLHIRIKLPNFNYYHKDWEQRVEGVTIFKKPQINNSRVVTLI